MQVWNTRSREERWSEAHASVEHAQQSREVGASCDWMLLSEAPTLKPLSECDFHRRERTSVTLINYVSLSVDQLYLGLLVMSKKD
jgi:hypothetical protein